MKTTLAWLGALVFALSNISTFAATHVYAGGRVGGDRVAVRVNVGYSQQRQVFPAFCQPPRAVFPACGVGGRIPWYGPVGYNCYPIWYPQPAWNSGWVVSASFGNTWGWGGRRIAPAYVATDIQVSVPQESASYQTYAPQAVAPAHQPAQEAHTAAPAKAHPYYVPEPPAEVPGLQEVPAAKPAVSEEQMLQLSRPAVVKPPLAKPSASAPATLKSSTVVNASKEIAAGSAGKRKLGLKDFPSLKPTQITRNEHTLAAK